MFHIELQTGNQQVTAVVDSGSEFCVLLEELFGKLNDCCMEMLLSL